MKSLRIISLLTFVMLAFAISASAQNVIVNPGAGSYPTLSAAFAAINAGTHTGTITVDILADTTEPAGGAVLNASGAGAASYTSIVISPSGGTDVTVSGAATAGLPLIDFNGADNVTIDGLNTSGNSLTIANTTVSAMSGTSTIRFIGGATNNTITNSSIQGSGTMSVATNGAVIFFSTDAVTANGNDNNTISNNEIGPAGANLPTKGILCNGSTTTTAIGNSGLIIDNNNIFDYFGAAVTSAGVAVNGGCNTFSITNNRFYQTATRTWTTGATHYGIFPNSSTATSGVQGMTITGNIIGYASNTQTGVYTLTGSTGSFRGIHYNGINAGTVSNINNNTIAAVSLTGVTSSGAGTTSPFMGIYVQTGLTNTNGNTIGSQSTTGSLTFSTTTTTATSVQAFFNFSSANWVSDNNNIGGISATNAGTGALSVFGMRADTTTSNTWSASGNTIGGTVANSISINATGVASQVVGLTTINAAATYSSNTIRNLTTNVGTGTTTGASAVGIVVNITATNHTLSQNTIHTLTNTNSTAASVVTGIQFTGSTANVVERNFIYNLLASTTSATAEINGIRVAGGTTQYRNNMIALGAGVTNALGGVAANSSVTGINGINEALGTNQFFHNSVYIGGAPTAGTGASYAFNGVQTINTRSFRDNIFFNARSNSGATGSNYAIKINGTAPNPTGLTINNNLYFANGSGGVFGFFNSLPVANLGAWRTAVGQDLGSFESNPQYNDPTNAVPDLHLHPTNPTVAEGNGVDVGVVLDFDGQTRSGLTPVDIGADAGNFVGIDLAAPVITYTPFLNTSSVANRVLSVTITDVTGVDTGGNAPRIYFNKNAGAYSSTACSLSSGTVNSGTWDCTIDNSLVGGVVATDVIRYFVVAQDTVGNLSSNPSAGFTGTNVNTVTTPPTLPNQYTIVAAVSGTIAVGTGEAITSLTNAGGIFEFINNSEVTGNVTIEITSDLTGETGVAALNEFASPYTILIKPSGAPRSITGTSATTIIKLNGADRVRIDGSTAAAFFENVVGGTPALRELTITNTGTGALIWIGTNATSGATGNTIRNLNLVGSGTPAAPSGQGIIAGSGATLGTAAESGRPNSDNTIQNNTARGVQNAVFALGNATTLDQNWVITENDFGSTVATEKLTFRGIFVANAQNFNINQNRISGISSATGTSATMSGILVDGVLNGGLIVRNEIKDIRQNNTVGWGSNGVWLNSTSTAANVTVANNFISDIASQGFNGFDVADNGNGIMVNTGGGYNIYYNTVVMNAEQVAVGGHSSALNVESAIPAGALDIRNNIFVSTQTIGNRYGVINQGTTAAAFSTINYNNYYSAVAGFNIGRLNAVNQTTLVGWQGATTQDANSLNADPLFASPTDFHLVGITSPMYDAGTPVSVLDDFDGEIRSVVGLAGGVPDIGADEALAPLSAEASITGRVITADGRGIRNAIIVVSGGNLTQPRFVRTGSFGYYQIEGLEVGETYILTVQSKRFTFANPSRLISLQENVEDIDFIAEPQ